MSAPHSSPARASTAHTWLRVFLWVFPGLCTIPLLFAHKKILDALPSPAWVFAVLALLSLAVLVVVSGCFDASLHLTRIHGRGNIPRTQLARFAGLFVMVQALLIPFLCFLIGAIVWSTVVQIP